MRRNEHIALTIILSIPFFGLFYVLNYFDGIYFMFPMIITTFLPDILEPPVDYAHRGFFHSKGMLRFLTIYVLMGSLIVLSISFVLGFVFHFFYYAFFGAFGYISHLLGDATTSMGLPD